MNDSEAPNISPDWRALVAAEGADSKIARPIRDGQAVILGDTSVSSVEVYLHDTRASWRNSTGTVGAICDTPVAAVRAALDYLRAEVDRRITELQAAQRRLGPMAHNRGESRTQGSEMSNEKIEKAAQAAHEVNRAFCLALGDNSQPPWSEAPDWQRSSAFAGVKAIADNPDLPASASHDGWLAEKAATGWKYGPVKDPAVKTHPCIVPFDELPPEQQAKDYLFGTVARAVLGLPLR